MYNRNKENNITFILVLEFIVVTTTTGAPFITITNFTATPATPIKTPTKIQSNFSPSSQYHLNLTLTI